MDQSSYQAAFRDIFKWIEEKELNTNSKYGDVWVITPERMNNKEQRRLNAQLGITRINYIKNEELYLKLLNEIINTTTGP